MVENRKRRESFNKLERLDKTKRKGIRKAAQKHHKAQLYLQYLYKNTHPSNKLIPDTPTVLSSDIH